MKPAFFLSILARAERCALCGPRGRGAAQPFAFPEDATVLRMKYVLKQTVDATARGKVRGFARRQDVSKRLSLSDAV